jgi:hypothetical protein
MDYLECTLRLENAGQASLQIGGQRYDDTPQLIPSFCESLKEFEDNPEKYGQSLFSALFPLGSSLDTGLRKALEQSQGQKLRLRLDIPATAPKELHRLYWELLYNQNAPTGPEFLTRSANIIFSRQRNVNGLLSKNTDHKQIKLLVIISCPNDLDSDYEPLNREEIKQQFSKWLNPRKLNNKLSSYDFLPPPVTHGAIFDKLSSGEYQAVQFYGHGYKTAESETGLILEKDDGKAHFLKESACLDLFKATSPLGLVVLMACHSDEATRATDAFSGLSLGLVRQNHQAVISVKKAVKIKTANSFLEYFYQGLKATDGVLDAAFNRAQAQVALADDDEWFLPTMYMRTPDGRLWAETSPSVTALAAPHAAGLNDTILNYFRSGKVVPIVGPGIWKGQKGVPDLFPTHAETATFLAQTLYNDPSYPAPAYPYQNSDLPHIARLYAIVEDSDYAPHMNVIKLYRDELCQRLGVTDPALAQMPLSEVVSKVAGNRFQQDPTEPHKLLARLTRLGCKTFITTNFDSFLYEALRREALAQGVSVGPRLRCYWSTGEDILYPPNKPENPFVFHLYGMDDDYSSLVLTEDNYLEFLRTLAQDWNQNSTTNDKSRLPHYLQGALGCSMLLFLGFDLSSLDFRVLFKGIVERINPKGIDPKRLAVVQIDDATPPGEVNKFITSDAQKLQIRIYGGSARDYLKSLCDALQLN